MRINESILDDYTPDSEQTSVQKLSWSAVSEDDLLSPFIEQFQIALELPVDDEIDTREQAAPFIERTYDYLNNCRNVKRFSKIEIIHDRFDKYVVGIDHNFRKFDTTTLFIANLYVSLQAKVEGYNSFKIWIHTKRKEEDYAFRINEEYWFDNETIRNILTRKWNEIQKNHYVLDAAYRFLDDDRNLPYQMICQEKFCTNVEQNAVFQWTSNLGKMITREFVCTLGVPMKVQTMELYKLARVNNYSYISLCYPLSGKLSISHLSLDIENIYNDETTQNV